MGVIFHFPATLHRLVGQNSTVELSSGTSEAVLTSLFNLYPTLQDRFFTAEGMPQLFIRVFYDGLDLRELPPDTPLRDGDSIIVVQALAGG